MKLRPIILMYHSVTDGEPVDPFGVSRKAFYDQISWLIDQKYQFLSLVNLVKSIKLHVFQEKETNSSDLR